MAEQSNLELVEVTVAAGRPQTLKIQLAKFAVTKCRLVELVSLDLRLPDLRFSRLKSNDIFCMEGIDCDGFHTDRPVRSVNPKCIN